MVRKYHCSTSVAWTIVTAFLVVLAIVVVTVALIVYPSTSKQRFCIEATNGNMPSGIVGDGDGFFKGYISFDVSQEVISWDFTHTGLDAISAIHIIGPHPVDQPFDGPVHIALCGLPSQNTCDNGTPNVVLGQIEQISNGQAPVTKIQQIRDNPSRYFLLVKTTVHPEGAVRDSLASRC